VIVIKFSDCKKCKYFKTMMEFKKVSDDYKGLYVINDKKEKEVEELKCYCYEFTPGYMRLIKNLGIELFEMEYRLSLRMEKEIREEYDKFMQAENELYDEYMERIKIDIPGWCPFSRKKLRIKGGFFDMDKTISMEINEWWNKFDLVERILIKDTIINLCDREISSIKKEKYINAIREKLEKREKKWIEKKISNCLKE